MPLTPSYTWKDLHEKVVVRIPTKGVDPKKIDIDGNYSPSIQPSADLSLISYAVCLLFCRFVVTSRTLKVNMAPYLLDLVLNQEINPIKHKASVKAATPADTPTAASASSNSATEKVLVIELFKQSPEIAWSALVYDPATAQQDGDAESLKAAVKAVKAEAVGKQQTLETTLTESRKDKRIENERFALRKQMTLDDAERSHLQNLKAEEKSQAEAEVYATFARMEAEAEAAKGGTGSKSGETSKQAHSKANAGVKPAQLQGLPNSSSAAIFDEKDIANDANVIDEYDDDIDDERAVIATAPQTRSQAQHDDNDETIRYVPAPRNQGLFSALPMPHSSVMDASCFVHIRCLSCRRG
jgi:hypothetical protein